MLRHRSAVLRKAIGAVKDQTSIGLAQFFAGTSPDLDVPVLKATSHDEVPVDERHVDEVLLLASCSRAHAAACVRTLAHRLAHTHSWVVALKCLSLVSSAIGGGGPFFLCEVVAATRRGVRLLDLSCFRPDSFPSAPREFTTFVRNFALYLDERLDCAHTGKLDPARLRDMKPPAVLDRLAAWQRALDRAVATRPAGAAMFHRLVQIALYTVVRESFDLYRGVSDGLAIVLGGFFKLQPSTCVGTYRACARAAKQFEKLDAFYALCRSIGVGRAPEYPTVQKISDAYLERFSEFLQANKATAGMATAAAPHKYRGPPLQPDMTVETQHLPAAPTPELGPRTGFASSKGKPRDEKGAVSDPLLPPNQPKVCISAADDEWERLLAESATAILNRRGHRSFSEVFEPTAAPFSQGRASVSFDPQQEYVNPFLLDDGGKLHGVPMEALQPEAGAFLLATNVSASGVLQVVDSAAMQQLLHPEQQRWGCNSNKTRSTTEVTLHHHDLVLL